MARFLLLGRRAPTDKSGDQACRRSNAVRFQSGFCKYFLRARPEHAGPARFCRVELASGNRRRSSAANIGRGADRSLCTTDKIRLFRHKTVGFVRYFSSPACSDVEGAHARQCDSDRTAASHRYRLALRLCADCRVGRSGNGGHVVKADSGIASLASLKGKRLVLPQQGALASYLIRGELNAAGISLQHYFSELRSVTAPTRAWIRCVAAMAMRRSPTGASPRTGYRPIAAIALFTNPNRSARWPSRSAARYPNR